MAYTGTVASRPSSISGAFQKLVETTDGNAIIRSKMDGAQTIKERRRVTVPIRLADVSVTVRAEEVVDWRTWYENNCQGGVLPTRFVFPPDCVEQIWRFSTPISYEWIDSNACRLTFSIEKLPHWVD